MHTFNNRPQYLMYPRYQVESKLRTLKKGNKTDRQVQNNLFGKIDTEGIVKIVSSMMKMSNFLAKNVIMTALTQGCLNA